MQKGRVIWPSSSGSENADSAEDVKCMKKAPKVKKLLKLLEKFEPHTELDKKLMRGLLVRDEFKSLAVEERKTLADKQGDQR